MSDSIPPEISKQSDPALSEYNLKYAKQLKRLAWSIEIVLVIVGLGIAFAQAASVPDGHSLLQSFPVFGVFVVLAMVELAKIPAATVVFHASGWKRLLALCGLVVAALISFETIFNGFERYAYSTTKVVFAAQNEISSLEEKIARLQSVSLEDETNGSASAELDRKRTVELQASVAAQRATAERARSNLDSEETKKLKDQLASLLEQQGLAGQKADSTWIEEQEWIMKRLADNAIDEKTRNQLNARMRTMPARQTVVEEARVAFDGRIESINSKIEASIGTPAPELVALADAAELRLKEAEDRLSEHQSAAAERAADRMDNQLATEQTARNRAAEIEEIEAGVIEATDNHNELAQASQMHRWASFVFGLAPNEVSDEQVKQTSAVFGLILGVVGALTGATVAIYSEWFRTLGAKPIVRIEQVPVEVIVEKKVEKIVEVEVPTTHFKYIPVPIGDDVGDLVESILQSLPPDAANELRSQLPKFSNKANTLKEVSNARAA